jgi:hypothetical protein
MQIIISVIRSFNGGIAVRYGITMVRAIRKHAGLRDHWFRRQLSPQAWLRCMRPGVEAAAAPVVLAVGVVAVAVDDVVCPADCSSYALSC